MSNFVPSPSDATSIATIRTLAADVVGKANSGHPGQSRGNQKAGTVFYDSMSL